MTSHPSLVLLNRHLAIKENSPFTLVTDSLTQSAYHLIQEIVYRFSGPVIYLSFETTIKPTYATSYMDCAGADVKHIQDFLSSQTPQRNPATKSLVIIDSLNYLEDESHASFISGIVQPYFSVVACYHSDAPTAQTLGYPLTLRLLSYIALSIFEIEPLESSDREEIEGRISRFQFPVNVGLNLTRFKVHLTNRRKSGKSQTNTFLMDTSTHSYEVYKQSKDNEVQDDEELLKDLTTFNLTTNSKQKLAKEQVELPFMEAQTELGKFSGAIVYEFEKDDDYDEEDPYEDPF